MFSSICPCPAMAFRWENVTARVARGGDWATDTMWITRGMNRGRPIALVAYTCTLNRADRALDKVGQHALTGFKVNYCVKIVRL